MLINAITPTAFEISSDVPDVLHVPGVLSVSGVPCGTDVVIF